MAKEKNVLDFYVLCNKLKYVIRTGWKDWHVTRERVESVAEHVYGVQMLALGMWAEYPDYKDLDIMRVIMMLAVHELGESVIGDITQFQEEYKNKEEMEHAAVHAILGNLMSGELIESLFLEFDSHDTPEALFAYQCDKLECDIQCKLYDEDGSVDLNNQEGNKTMDNSAVKASLDAGDSWSTMWLKFGQHKYPYDKNFMAVSQYAMDNKLQNKGR